jgi:hypothetical protein
VYFVPSDDSASDIRPSAKRVLPKWKKRYPRARFFVLPKQPIQLRAIVFDRNTGRDNCFAGAYTEDDEGIYLGVTQQIERCDRKSFPYLLLKEVISRAGPYEEKPGAGEGTKTGARCPNSEHNEGMHPTAQEPGGG